MKIVCSKENLLKGLTIAMRAIPVRTTMTILECILIDAQAARIRLVSNDMEMGIETYVDGDIQEKGIAALDAKILFEIIRKLPDNDVTIRIDGVKCGTMGHVLVRASENFRKDFHIDTDDANAFLLKQGQLVEILPQEGPENRRGFLTQS